MFAYVQQVASLGALFAFNVLVPRVVGLPAFGEFAALQGLIFTVFAVFGGGFDLLVLRAAGALPGSIDHATVRRLLLCRLATVALGAALVLALPGPLLRGVADPGAMATRVAALLATSALSGFLINALSAARLGRTTGLFMIAHGAAYVGVPVAWSLARGATAATIVDGCIAVYLVTIVVELYLLQRVPDVPRTATPRWTAVWREAFATSGASLFDTARSALPFWLAASLVVPEGLALVRIALSIAGAAVAILPLQPQLIVPMGGLTAAHEANLVQVTRTLATGAAIATVAGCAALAALVYRAEAYALLSVAALTGWCTWAMVWARLATSLAFGRLGAAALGRRTVLAAAVIGVLSLLTAQVDSAGTWLPLAPAVGAWGAAQLLATPAIRAGLAARSDYAWLALTSLVGFAGARADAPLLALAAAALIGAAYLRSSRADWMPFIRHTMAWRGAR